MTEIREKKLSLVTGAFKLAFSSGLQEKELKAYHEREQKRLETERKKAEANAAKEQRSQHQQRLADLRKQYEQDRMDRVLERSMQRAKLKAEWKQLETDRQAAMTSGGREPGPRQRNPWLPDWIESDTKDDRVRRQGRSLENDRDR